MQGTLHFFSLIRSIKIQSTKTSYKSDTDLGAGARKDIEWRGAGRDGGVQAETEGCSGRVRQALVRVRAVALWPLAGKGLWGTRADMGQQ